VIYDRARYTEEAMRRLLATFRRCLRIYLANAAALVSRLPLLTDEEREQILVQWNDTSVPTAPASIQNALKPRLNEPRTLRQ